MSNVHSLRLDGVARIENTHTYIHTYIQTHMQTTEYKYIIISFVIEKGEV